MPERKPRTITNACVAPEGTVTRQSSLLVSEYGRHTHDPVVGGAPKDT